MSLSDKIMNGWDFDVDLLDPERVKEFIKELKEELKKTIKENNGINFKWIEQDIDNLAGEKLI